MNKQSFRELCEQKEFNEAQIAEFELAISHEINIKSFASPKFSAGCMHEIILGIMHGIDVSVYTNPEFTQDFMRYIRLGLESKCPMDKYATTDYDTRKLEWIYNGFMNGIDVTKYDNPEFSAEKMYQAYHGLLRYPDEFDALNIAQYSDLQLYQFNEACRKNLSIHSLCNPESTDMQMAQIIKGLLANIDISELAPAFSAAKMEQIRLGRENHVDTSIYEDPEFSAFQMKQIRLGEEQGLDVSVYASTDFSDKVMLLIRLGMLEGIDVQLYAIPGIEDAKAQAIYDKLMELQTAISITDPEDYEVGSAYINLLGWESNSSDDNAELSAEFAADTTSVGIANPDLTASSVVPKSKSTKAKKSAISASANKNDNAVNLDAVAEITPAADNEVTMEATSSEQAETDINTFEDILSAGASLSAPLCVDKDAKSLEYSSNGENTEPSTDSPKTVEI